jgi:2-methylcitrate dehydratase PrpD
MSTQSVHPIGPADATQRLAQYCATLTWADIPQEVASHANLCVLDAIGCCLFGSTLPWTRILAEVVVEQGGAPQAAIWGTPHRTTLAQAALVNCAAERPDELDSVAPLVELLRG